MRGLLFIAIRALDSDGEVHFESPDTKHAKILQDRRLFAEDGDWDQEFPSELQCDHQQRLVFDRDHKNLESLRCLAEVVRFRKSISSWNHSVDEYPPEPFVERMFDLHTTMH